MKKLLSCLLCIYCVSSMFSQKRYKIRSIAFYNLENLFDTINDHSKDDEFSPIMTLKGDTSKIYWDKINKLSHVISLIGKDKTNTSPAILGVAEIENENVLQDLINSNNLKNSEYNFIHFNSPDKRGIDVALLYQPKYFKPIHYEAITPNIYNNNRKVYTRDILWVTGYLDDEKIHLIINHWPSRRGGEAKSRYLREKAAYKVHQIIQKIREKEDTPKIIIMGDFNDDPINSSFKTVLNTKAKIHNVDTNDIFNPYEHLFKKGYNTLGYRDNINLFDQILLTQPLLHKKDAPNFSSYKMFKAGIYNTAFLTQQHGKLKGYPFRSFLNNQYTGGYSDHYPVYIYLIKEQH